MTRSWYGNSRLGHGHFLRLRARHSSKQDNTAQKNASKLPYPDRNSNQQKPGEGLSKRGKRHCEFSFPYPNLTRNPSSHFRHSKRGVRKSANGSAKHTLLSMRDYFSMRFRMHADVCIRLNPMQMARPLSSSSSSSSSS